MTEILILVLLVGLVIVACALNLVLKRLDRIDDELRGAIILLPRLDASSAQLCDYGNLVSVSASKEDFRIGWLMPPESARMMRDALSKVVGSEADE